MSKRYRMTAELTRQELDVLAKWHERRAANTGEYDEYEYHNEAAIGYDMDAQKLRDAENGNPDSEPEAVRGCSIHADKDVMPMAEEDVLAILATAKTFDTTIEVPSKETRTAEKEEDLMETIDMIVALFIAMTDYGRKCTMRLVASKPADADLH